MRFDYPKSFIGQDCIQSCYLDCDHDYASCSLPPYMYYTTTVTIELHIYLRQFSHVVTGHMHAVSEWP